MDEDLDDYEDDRSHAADAWVCERLGARLSMG